MTSLLRECRAYIDEFAAAGNKHAPALLKRIDAALASEQSEVEQLKVRLADMEEMATNQINAVKVRLAEAYACIRDAATWECVVVWVDNKDIRDLTLPGGWFSTHAAAIAASREQTSIPSRSPRTAEEAELPAVSHPDPRER